MFRCQKFLPLRSATLRFKCIVRQLIKEPTIDRMYGCSVFPIKKGRILASTKTIGNRKKKKKKKRLCVRLLEVMNTTLDFYGGFYYQAPIWAHTSARGLEFPIVTSWEVVILIVTSWEVTIDFACAHVRRPSPNMWKTEIFRCPHFEEKKVTEKRSWPRWS